MMQNAAHEALIALRRILKATDANIKALASISGLTASQLRVLQLLASREKMLTSELARAVTLNLATVSLLIDKLQSGGLVTRQRGESDRRQVWVAITDIGRQQLASAPDLLQEKFRARFERLADWEQTFVLTALLRVVALLDAEDIDASPVLDVVPIAEPD